MKKILLYTLLIVCLTFGIAFAAGFNGNTIFTSNNDTLTIAPPTTFSGNVIHSGTTTLTGAVSNSGLITNGSGVILDHNLLAATAALTTAHCGTKVTIGHATEFVTTLPTATAGCEIEFGILLAPSGANYTIVTAASANVIYGSLVVNGAVVPCVTEDTITSTSGAGAIGDTFRVWSDGTNWYVTGDGVANTAWTCTQAT